MKGSALLQTPTARGGGMQGKGRVRGGRRPPHFIYLQGQKITSEVSSSRDSKGALRFLLSQVLTVITLQHKAIHAPFLYETWRVSGLGSPHIHLRACGVPYIVKPVVFYLGCPWLSLSTF